MFVRASTLVLAMVASVIAAPGATPTTITTSQCDTGNLQCCDQTDTVDGGLAGSLLGALGLDAPIGSLLGLGCTPITVIGTGSGAACTQNPVCCSNNNFSGVINVGCTPVNLDL